MPKKKKQKKIEIPTMITAARVKTFVSENYDMRTAGDFVPELNEKVAVLINDAVKRCDSNRRGTVRAGDL